MLEQNFQPPNQQISMAETKKRKALIDWFCPVIDRAIVGMFITGSMAYGYDYSVKESSDIDMQLIITPETVTYLYDLNIFEAQELSEAISGYRKGVYSQFSLVFKKDGVSFECHFWDLSAFVAAITYQNSETKRLRSNISTPSTDHGFSFAHDESIKDYYGEMIDGYAVAVFPSYREESGMLYLCRPITNMLGLPIVCKTNSELDKAIVKTWEETIERLVVYADNGMIYLKKFNIINTLPGKNKMRQDVLDKIQQKTAVLLEERGIICNR